MTAPQPFKPRKYMDPYRVWQGTHFGPTHRNPNARPSNTQAPRTAK